MNDDKPSALCSPAQAAAEHDWEVCAAFADFIFDGKRPANHSLFNRCAFR